VPPLFARRFQPGQFCLQTMGAYACGALAQRLAQNGVQEKLTALWIDRCRKQLPPPAERKAA